MKIKVRKTVKNYEKMFPEEFEAFLRGMRTKRDMLSDKRFGVSQGDHVIERALHEMPETLFAMLDQVLNKEEFEEFHSQKGSRWFAEAFPAYRIPEEI